MVVVWMISSLRVGWLTPPVLLVNASVHTIELVNISEHQISSGWIPGNAVHVKSQPLVSTYMTDSYLVNILYVNGATVYVNVVHLIPRTIL